MTTVCGFLEMYVHTPPLQSFWAFPLFCGAMGLAGVRAEALPLKNRLKVLRAERDWSQADLAEQLDVSRQTINALETGKYDPSLPLAFRIARLLASPSKRSSMTARPDPKPGNVTSWLPHSTIGPPA